MRRANAKGKSDGAILSESVLNEGLSLIFMLSKAAQTKQCAGKYELVRSIST